MYEQIGGWDTSLRLAPDREFWIRLSSKGAFKFVPTQLASYRLHKQSISFKETSEEVSREYIRVLDRYFNGELGSPLKSVVERREEAYSHANLISQGIT